MGTNIYTVYFNPNYNKIKNNVISSCKTIIEPFLQLYDAKHELKDLIDIYEDSDGEYTFNSMLCEIHHKYIGEPNDKYEEFVQYNDGIIMEVNRDGEIISYQSKNNLISWTPKDMLVYNPEYKIGDIVDVIQNGVYQGQYVVLSTPKPFLEFIQSDYKHNENYLNGYYLYGHNPHLKYLESADTPYFHHDIHNIYDENILLTTEILQKDFYDGLNIYAEFYNYIKANNINVFGKIKDLLDIDNLYKVYFHEKDYVKFNYMKYVMYKIVNGE